MSGLPLVIREYRPVGDEDFIYATWIKGYRGSSYARAVPTPLYNRLQRKRIDRLLEHGANIRVAANRVVPEQIYGYCVTQDNTLHWIYVKSNYRLQGVGKALLSHLEREQPIFYTHKGSDIWLERKLIEDADMDNWIYHPYWFEEGMEKRA